MLEFRYISFHLLFGNKLVLLCIKLGKALHARKAQMVHLEMGIQVQLYICFNFHRIWHTCCNIWKRVIFRFYKRNSTKCLTKNTIRDGGSTAP